MRKVGGRVMAKTNVADTVHKDGLIGINVEFHVD